MKNAWMWLLIFCSPLVHDALAQGPDSKSPVAKKDQSQPVSAPEAYGVFRSVDAWVGERFVFLATPDKGSRPSYYQHFQVGDVPHAFPDYETHAGKIAKVVSVLECHDHWEVTFEMEDTHERLFASARSGGISGIAPVRDIEEARERCLGKTLWYKGDSMKTVGEHENKTQTVPLTPLVKVTVIRVVAGWENDHPVRFVLETSQGKFGYVDIAWSGTNAYTFSKKQLPTFSTMFAAEGSPTIRPAVDVAMKDTL